MLVEILSRRYRAPHTPPLRGKPALLLVALILAGCGGSSAPRSAASDVAAPGSRFRRAGRLEGRAGARRRTTADARLGVRAGRRRSASLKPYTASALRTVASASSTTRMGQVAEQSGGTVSGTLGPSTAGGIRSHTYDVRGRRPRRPSTPSSCAACASTSCSAAGARRAPTPPASSCSRASSFAGASSGEARRRARRPAADASRRGACRRTRRRRRPRSCRPG